MPDPSLQVLLSVRWKRARQERRMGWPRSDWSAFLTGQRDHWPSMQDAFATAARASSPSSGEGDSRG